MIPKLLRRKLDSRRVNFTINSQILGLNPVEDVEQFIQRLLPKDYGHSLIRLGGRGDGGYLVPDDLVGISACYSPGSAGSWKFEKELWEIFEIPSYICDTKDQMPSDLDSSQTFSDGWVGPSNQAGFFTLDTWISKEHQGSQELILQMDIEGAEYLTLLATSEELLKRFRIMVIEFHHFEGIKNLHAFRLLYEPLFARILEIFDVVHLHPNNCCGSWDFGTTSFPTVLELTFHRKNRRRSEGTHCHLPNKLDEKNSESGDEIVVRWPRGKS